jgi:hypothetical protein
MAICTEIQMKVRTPRKQFVDSLSIQRELKLQQKKHAKRTIQSVLSKA